MKNGTLCKKMKLIFSHTKNILSTMVLLFSLEEEHVPLGKNNCQYYITI